MTKKLSNTDLRLIPVSPLEEPTLGNQFSSTDIIVVIENGTTLEYSSYENEVNLYSNAEAYSKQYGFAMEEISKLSDVYPLQDKQIRDWFHHHMHIIVEEIYYAEQ